MKKWIFAAAGAVGMVVAASASAGTLEDVRARGHLNCVVNTGLTGFASPDDAGNWTGFDVEFCRAVAAAVLGDASKAKSSLGWEAKTPLSELVREMVAEDLNRARRDELLAREGYTTLNYFD